MIVTKYVVITPANISNTDGVYTMTLPSTFPGNVEGHLLAMQRSNLSPYDALSDKRRLYAIKGEEVDINTWITDNSTMVIEKTFLEADAVGKELQPAQVINVHKIIIEDGQVKSEEDVPTDIPAFDLQTELNKRGL